MVTLTTFTLFTALPFELRRTIWLLALPSPPCNLTFTSLPSTSSNLILNSHQSYTSTTFHIDRESRFIALSECSFLYKTRQPILTNLSRAFIILQSGTMWNLLTVAQILSDDRTTIRKYAIYSDVILHCMVHNRTPRSSTWGAGSSSINFFAPFYKFSLEAGLGRDDAVLIVHKKWNSMLVNDLDVEKLKEKFKDGSRSGSKTMFERIVGWGKDEEDLEALPRLEHIAEDDFEKMSGE